MLTCIYHNDWSRNSISVPEYFDGFLYIQPDQSQVSANILSTGTGIYAIDSLCKKMNLGSLDSSKINVRLLDRFSTYDKISDRHVKYTEVKNKSYFSLSESVLVKRNILDYLKIKYKRDSLNLISIQADFVKEIPNWVDLHQEIRRQKAIHFYYYLLLYDQDIINELILPNTMNVAVYPICKYSFESN